MTDEIQGIGDRPPDDGELIEIDLGFASMRRFQAEFSPNLSREGLFIDTGEPLSPGSVVRFRVILPEEFVFLEGTAVVEWIRPAGSLVDGVPGMALRFVTLSPQNQELVEQLVQDYVSEGGTPFNLDVRPAPTDYPTDALEGMPGSHAAPASAEPVEEAFRLTIRGAGPRPDEPAEQRPQEAASDLAEGIEAGQSDDAAGGGETASEEHESDIVSRRPEPAEPVGLEAASGSEPSAPAGEALAGLGDPPELDWGDVLDEIDQEGGDREAGQVVIPDLTDTEAAAEEIVVDPGPITVEPTFLKTPSEFDHGPEVLDDTIDDEFMGGPAFDVSLPSRDDEPDSTPALPDDGRDDITVASEDEVAAHGAGRRRLGSILGVAAVLAVAALVVVLWPTVAEWLEGRRGAPAVSTESSGEVETPPPAVVASKPVDDAGLGADPAEGVPAGAGEVAEAGVPDEATDDTAEEAVGEPQGPVMAGGVEATAGEGEGEQPEEVGGEVASDAAATAVPARSADAVSEIAVTSGSGGTVVTIRGNGSLEDGAITLSTLPSPPRVVVRIVGISETYRPYTIEAGTAEVARVRIGLHEERRPPELWVVMDVTDPAVAVQRVDIRGSTAELLLAGQ